MNLVSCVKHRMATKQLVLVSFIVNLLLMEESATYSLENEQTPSECWKYTQLVFRSFTNSYQGRIKTKFPVSLCSGKTTLQPNNTWYRFELDNFSVNEPLIINPLESLSHDIVRKKLLRCLEHLVPVHPCRENKTLSSKVCFRLQNYLFAVAVNITNCRTFYVYQLPQLTCRHFDLSVDSRNYTHPPNCSKGKVLVLKVIFIIM